MTEPDPNPQVDETAMANGSGQTEDSGKEAVPIDKPGEQNKDVEELKVRNENNVMEEMKNLEGDRAVEEMEDGKEKNGAEGGGIEKKSGEEVKEGAEKNGAEGRNGMEETNDEESINSEKDINDQKDTKKEEEIADVDENKVVEKVKDQEEEHIMEAIKELGEKEGPVVKKNSNEKMDTEKKVEDAEEGKGEKGIADVEMAEAEEVKEEERMDTGGGVEDDVVKLGENDDIHEKEASGNTDEEADGIKKVEVSRKKRSRSGRKAAKKSEEKEKKEGAKVGEAKEKKDGMKKVKEQLSSPTPPFIERPVRERKTVERLVEVIEKEPNKGVVIEKGRGTPLKDIPNVAYKLAKKKPGDLKLLHHTLFGRKGKAVDFKNHILQFSGFAWHESDDMQRAKVKERLDKCVKDSLLDLCDLLDIHVSKANARKEDLISKLLDFMVAPHAKTDVLLNEQQSPKSRKRKAVARGSVPKGTEDTLVTQSRKKRMKIEHAQSSKEKSATDTEDEDEHEEDEDNRSDGPSEDEELGHFDSEKEKESKEANEKDEDKDKDKDDEDSGKGKISMKKSPKEQNSLMKEKVKTESSSKKTPLVTTAKSPEKTPSSTHAKSDEKSDVGDKVFVRKKKKDVDPPKKKSTSKDVDPPKKKSTSKPDVKEKSSGKRSTGDKSKSEGAGQSNPSKEELRKTICEILKKVDLNTATFTDILKKLATHYKVDLTPMKAAIKLIVQEELTRLADEAAESEEDEQDSEKEENPTPRGKKVEA